MNFEKKVIEFSIENDQRMNLKDEWDKSGIWIVYGKKEDEVAYTCLEVGETKSIQKELNKDLNMMFQSNKIDENRNKIECKCFRKWSRKFSKMKGENRRSAKWRDIVNSYKTICVKYISGSENLTEKERLKVEINIALHYQASYFFPNNFKKQCKYIFNETIDWNKELQSIIEHAQNRVIEK